MWTATRAQRAVAGGVLGAFLVLAVAPTTVALYRCTLTQAVHASPCCAGTERQEPGDAPSVRPDPCCEREVVQLQRAVSEAARAGTPALPPAPIAIASRPADLPAACLAWREHPGCAPSVYLRTCSLLI